MRIILLGATGMLGQGVLREALLDPGVEHVLVIGRTPTGVTHRKLTEVVTTEPAGAVEGGYDACLFCLGVSSVGMKEPEYTRITYDITMAVAKAFEERNPGATFIYVSGAGTDSTERGRSMWARVKGRTENALLAMNLKATMFRPGYIHPTHGTKSKTRLYAVGYAIATPLYPVLRRLFPSAVTTNENVAKAMLQIVRDGSPKPLLDNRDINALVSS